MFKKSKPQEVLWRALPLRNEQISIQNSLAVLPGQIWFTPEVIIADAIDFLVDVVLLWQTFRKLVPLFIIRSLAIFVLLFLVVGSRENTNISFANAQNRAETNKNLAPKLEIKTGIKALESQIFSWPVQRTYISTYFSYFHKGIDLPSPYGNKIEPLTAGQVIFAGWDGGFGKAVHIRHQKGYVTKYSHLSSINVKAGQKVGRQTTIGRIGSTGVSTGAHLHFEVYKNRMAINPLGILP